MRFPTAHKSTHLKNYEQSLFESLSNEVYQHTASLQLHVAIKYGNSPNKVQNILAFYIVLAPVYHKNKNPETMGSAPLGKTNLHNKGDIFTVKINTTVYMPQRSGKSGDEQKNVVYLRRRDDEYFAVRFLQ